MKLLGELLLDRSNFNVMMRFISAEHNLQVVMNLLRDKSANIQFEAFHVFKVFVANPNKPAKIRLILYKNRQKLCTYLKNFHQDKEDDDSQFSEEKKLLIATLNTLEKPSSDEIRQEMEKDSKNSSSDDDDKLLATVSEGEKPLLDDQHTRKDKGCLRQALAAASSTSVGTDVILEESDVQLNTVLHSSCTAPIAALSRESGLEETTRKFDMNMNDLTLTENKIQHDVDETSLSHTSS